MLWLILVLFFSAVEKVFLLRLESVSVGQTERQILCWSAWANSMYILFFAL